MSFFTISQAQGFEIGNVVYYDLNSEYGNYFWTYDTSHYATSIDDADITSAGQSDAYDGAFGVSVNDSAFYAVPDDVSGTTYSPFIMVTTAPQIINDFSVTKQFYFLETQPIVRFLLKIENTSSSELTLPVKIASNFGSDGITVIDSCSTANVDLSDDDRCFISSDTYSDVTPDGDPVLTWVRQVLYNPVSKPNLILAPVIDEDNFMDSLIVTVPANSYAFIMQFNRLDSTFAAAKNYVSTFDDMEAMTSEGLFAGIAPDDLLKIVNWDFNAYLPVAEIQNASNFTISPNSNNGKVIVKFSQDRNYTELQVANIFGAIAETIKLDSNIEFYELNTSNLNSGVYFINLKNNENIIHSEKMIKL